MLIIKGLVRSAIQVSLFAAMLLIPAGTWDWPRAIQFLGAYGVVVFAAVLALGIVAPASLEARMRAPASSTQPTADRIASAFLFAAMLGWFVFIPIDVFRLRLLPPTTFAVSVFGAVLGAAGYGVIFTALIQNAFAAPIVRDQSERGQILVDTGLYGLVRHPFYSGLLVFFAGIALWLESYAAVLALPIVGAALAGRIFAEERFLREALAGYSEYMNRVRYRLVPFLW